MSKFKNGDKIRLKAGVQGWSSGYSGVVWEFPYEDVDGISVGNLVRDWEDDFELSEESPEKHIHYDIIVQWSANPSRIVQYLDIVYGEQFWHDCRDSNHPAWNPETRYRFKPERQFPTTNMTEKELGDIFLTTGGWNTLDNGLKAIANAAIKKYILDEGSK